VRAQNTRAPPLSARAPHIPPSPLPPTRLQSKKKKGAAAKKAAPAKGAKKAAPAKAKAPAKGAGAAAASAAKKKGKAKAAASDDDDDDEDEDDEEEAPAKAKGKASKAAPAKKRKGKEGEDTATASSSSSAAAGKAPRRVKALKPVEMIEKAMKAYKWWEAPPLPKDVKWAFMEHTGVIFPPPYEPHGVRMRYEGAEVELTPEQEELATYYAQVSKDSLQLANPKTARVFNKNFFRDFVRVLGPAHTIQKFDLCDFEPIRAHLAARSLARKSAGKEEKDAAKESKVILQLRHGFALVDGHTEKMGNYTVEPPGLFRGRGEHPKMGVLKRRVQPEDITINVAHLAVVPACPVPGHAWKRVIHDPTVTWLAYWKDSVAGNHKYVSLAASSSFKGRSDLAKYEKARKLKKYIHKIRE
jgi:DNA topoisomerase-1